jgi:cyclic pyranopterin phosphate synthase
MENKLPLKDHFGRMMKKLRISVTDRCNFRCSYCMPENPLWKPRKEILNFAEIYKLAKIFVERFGIEEIRITGGEPLLRRGLPLLFELLNTLKYKGLRRLSLTTNGSLLKDFVIPLSNAGIDDVNVSLDTLDESKFWGLTGGNLERVLEGIEEARKVGLRVKLNAVVIRGYNDGRDIIKLLRWAMERKLTLRFIEFMPFDSKEMWSPEKVVCEREIIDFIGRYYRVEPLKDDHSEPARYYLVDGKQRVGVIPTVSAPFCDFCNRIRLTADGRLVLCLFSTDSVDLKAPLRRGEGELFLLSLIKRSVYKKPKGFLDWERSKDHLPMHTLGG